MVTRSVIIHLPLQAPDQKMQIIPLNKGGKNINQLIHLNRIFTTTNVIQLSRPNYLRASFIYENVSAKTCKYRIKK